jgi:hypothetical protein
VAGRRVLQARRRHLILVVLRSLELG